ncbi:MAG: alpha/beta fold hydrolase, partial [Acidimicrobiia bacterium]
MRLEDWRLDEEYGWRSGTVRWARLGDGPPVVLCHGTPWSSFVWRDLAVYLSADHSVYVWDMIGYGKSDKPDADVSLGAQSDLFAALLEHWDLDAPHVLAHDFGGAVALRSHLLDHRNFRSLALVDVVAVRPWGSPFFRLVGEHPDVVGRLPEALHRAVVR